MSDSTKIIVISDLHLTEGEAPLFGIDTTARFAKAVDHVMRYHADAELVVIAGDIADDETEGAYDHFFRIIADLKLPWIATLGNHDNRELFEKRHARNATTQKFDHAKFWPNLSLFVLDTREDGESFGRLTQGQLDWLEAQHFGELNLIITHHPPHDLGIWTDCIKLENEQAMFDVLDRKPGKHAILSGHVHLASSGMWRGYPVTTMSGNHNTVTPILEKTAQPDDDLRTFNDGPADYSVVIADELGIRVITEVYDRSNGLFSEARVRSLQSHFSNA